MTEPTMTLIDIHGAYRGQERVYSKTAGEIALANGFARRPDEPDPYGAPEGTALPSDFPGREDLAASGIETIEAVPKTRRALERLPGIGPATAGKILDALGVVE